MTYLGLMPGTADSFCAGLKPCLGAPTAIPLERKVEATTAAANCNVKLERYCMKTKLGGNPQNFLVPSKP